MGRTPAEIGDESQCLDGATECVIPNTQNNGALRLSFTEETNRLLAGVSDAGNYNFKVVTTGDNDQDRDCSHTGLELLVEYRYLQE